MSLVLSALEPLGPYICGLRPYRKLPWIIQVMWKSFTILVEVVLKVCGFQPWYTCFLFCGCSCSFSDQTKETLSSYPRNWEQVWLSRIYQHFWKVKIFCEDFFLWSEFLLCWSFSSRTGSLLGGDFWKQQLNRK